MNTYLRILAGVLLLSAAACVDFEYEEQLFCEHTPERCPDEVTEDGGTTPDSGVPDAGNPFCGNKLPNPGEVCDDGNQHSGDGCSADCLSDERCGNGYQDVAKNEDCDDGNNVTEIACPYGTPTCTACSSDCSSTLSLVGPYCGDTIQNGLEACDDGNTITEPTCPYGTRSCTACDERCATVLSLSGPYCGDNSRNGPEACDDGNTVSETSCPYGTPTCTGCSSDCRNILNLTGLYCGDNARNGAEACDDGNTVTETECPYGTPTCSRCVSDCSDTVSLTGPYCGDNARNGPEVCDDGNTVTELQCPYGTPTCTRCRADCGSELSLTGPYCGDGTVSGPETCDDGNTSACGSCSATCSQGQLSVANGSITVLSSSPIVDGDLITVSDGIHPAVVFEFDRNQDGTTQGEVIEWLSTNRDLVAQEIQLAINRVSGADFTISADRNANVVLLTNTRFGDFGNRPITTTVTSSGLALSGMSGGAGANCAVGTGCVRNEDCSPGLVCRADKRCGAP